MPQINVSTSSPTDWFAIGSLFVGVLATVLVVLVGAWITTHSNRRHAESMRMQARSEKVADSRQAWINELRTCLADFIANVLNVYQLQGQISRKKLKWQATALSEAANAAKGEEELNYTVAQNTAITDAERARTKILLMLNPKEPEYLAIQGAMTQALADAMDSLSPQVVPDCETLIALAQPLLKSEWERVKLFE